MIETVFEYLAMLRQKGLPKEIFEEIQATTRNQFEFKNKISGMNKAVRTSEALGDYPPELVNKINYMMENYEPEKFLETVERLTADDFYVILKNNEFENLTENGEYYGFEYSKENLNPKLIEKLRMIHNPESGYTCKIFRFYFLILLF